MKKKYFIIIMIFLAIIISCAFTVKVRAEEVTDRQIAIFSNMVGGSFPEGKKVSEAYANSGGGISYFATKHELDDWYIEDFTEASIANMGLTAGTIVKDNNVIVAFRGTDTEWLEDFICGMTNFHTQEIFANNYIDNVMSKYSKKDGNYKIYVTGHSLGGFLAQTAGVRVEQRAKNYSGIELGRIVDFNAMSLNFIGVTAALRISTINTLKQLADKGKLIEYCVLGDIVSAGGHHYGEIRTILPSIDTITDIRDGVSLIDGAQKIVRVSSVLTKIIQGEQIVNLFKTETDTARNLYQVDSVVGYLNLTHKQEDFSSLQCDKSNNKVEVILKNQEGKQVSNEITIKGNTTLKANTKFGSCKTYKWYLSDDGENWGNPVKVCSLYDNMGRTEKIPTNTFDVSLKQGETKYCKVEAYYDDKYTVSKLNINWYKKADKQPTDYTSGKVENVIKIISTEEGNQSKNDNLISLNKLNSSQSNGILGILKNIGKNNILTKINPINSDNTITKLFNKIGGIFKK